MGKRAFFSTNGAGKVGCACATEGTGSYCTLNTKVNSQWIKDLCKQVKTVKVKDENITFEKLHDNGFDNDFLGLTSKAQETK
jgi:hypothetical protein